MAFYIRKSLRFGPLRFNLSKSGVGVSAGVKGFRVGTGPRGNYVHMGRGGLYYRASLPSISGGSVGVPRRALRPERTTPPPMPSASADSEVAMREIDSGSAARIVDSSSHALVQELREKREKFRFSRLGLAVVVVFTFLGLNAPRQHLALPVILLSIGLYWVLHIFDVRRKTTVIFYELADDSADVFRTLHDAFDHLASARKLWHIPAEGKVHDSKYHAGADTLVNREPTMVRFSNPPFVKTNIPTPSLRVGTQTLCFFPDRVLIFDANEIGGLAYDSLRIDISKTRFIETESVPNDARVVDQTWRYVNKKGGPDRRFSNNPIIPVAEYESVRLSSRSGLNEALMVSRVGSFSRIAEAVKRISHYLASSREGEGVQGFGMPTAMPALLNANVSQASEPPERDWLPYIAAGIATGCVILLLFANLPPKVEKQAAAPAPVPVRIPSSPSVMLAVETSAPKVEQTAPALVVAAPSPEVLASSPSSPPPPAPKPIPAETTALRRLSEDTPLPATVTLANSLTLISRGYGAIALGNGQHVTVTERSGTKLTVIRDGHTFIVEANELKDAIVVSAESSVP
jgi:hypothetical protein